MGVWIEISHRTRLGAALFVVTPCVGVWIEIKYNGHKSFRCKVTPCVGVWIEIKYWNKGDKWEDVTPCVGVWIEIGGKDSTVLLDIASLPAWECGLK